MLRLASITLPTTQQVKLANTELSPPEQATILAGREEKKRQGTKIASCFCTPSVRTNASPNANASANTTNIHSTPPAQTKKPLNSRRKAYSALRSGHGQVLRFAWGAFHARGHGHGGGHDARSATGEGGSIGGTDVEAFLRAGSTS